MTTRQGECAPDPRADRGLNPVVADEDVAAVLGTPARLTALTATGLLERPYGTPELDRISRLAARAIGVPIVAVSLVHAAGQHLAGFSDPGAERCTPLSSSICRHVVARDAALVVADARLDPVLRTNAAVTEGGVVAYAGVPLRDAAGQVLGSFCAADTVPRDWTEQQLADLEEFAQVAAAEVDSNVRARAVALLVQEQATVVDTAREAYVAVDTTGQVVEWNRAAVELFGWTREQAVGRTIDGLIVPPDLCAAHLAGLARLARTGESTLLGQRLELPAVRRDGQDLTVEMTLAQVAGPAGLRIHGFLHDISERRRTQRIAACELAVTAALMSTNDVASSAATVLELVVDALDGCQAALWQVDDDRAHLVPTATWTAPGEDGHDPWPPRLRRGDGAPGQAWEQRATVLAPHGDASRGATVLAVPVSSGRQGLGVLVVVVDDATALVPAVQAMLEAVAAHIGQVLERSRAERLARQLALARAHLDRTVAQIDDYLFTLEIGEGGRVQVRYASPDGSAVFGGDVDLGAGLDVVLAALVHEDDRDLLADFLSRVTTGRAAELEARLVGSDGRTRWVWARGRPRTDGNRRLFDGICSDVTEQRRLTEELRASRALLQAVLDNSDTVVFAKDGDGRYLFVNNSWERLFGVTEGEVLGHTDFSIFPRHVAQRMRENDLRVLAAGTLARREEEVPTTTGTRTFLSSTFPLPDAHGVSGICGVAVDITERKEAEQLLGQLLDGEREQVERLRDLDRLKDEFVALASHELRSPLTCVHGYTELLLEDPGDLAEQQLAFLAIIKRNTDRLLRLIGDLLDLTQISDPSVELDTRPMSLSDLVGEAVHALVPEAERKGLALEHQLDVAPVLGDPVRLRQVVDNLLTNALKYTPRGGRVQVCLQEVGGRARLSVRDTGIGVPEDELPQLFTRFFRSSRARAVQIDGTGLGLAVAKAVVDRHGGSIAVRSASPGTVFTVELPTAA